MKLTNKTFKNMLEALEKNYLNWELPDESLSTWKNVLALVISDEFYPVVILDWITHVITPPKNPAEIIKHACDMVAKEYGNADAEANIIINSARNAYRFTEEFEAFSESYSNSFASLINDMPEQDAYIINEIQNHSNSPKVLIQVYDELKGEVSDCFKGGAEQGVDFLRTHIKKNRDAKVAESVKGFLVSGETNYRRLTGNAHRLLEA